METNGSEHVADTLSEKSDPGQRVHADVDVLQVTKKRPYLEINFIGTYLAVCLGALACYGGFVMPATSLALINEDIGKSEKIFNRFNRQ